MNERIRELAEQAQLHARQGMGKCIIELKHFDKDAVSERYAKDFEEKFAELIVRECMDLALVEQKRYASITHRNMSECAVALGNFSLLMKDHFEDEE